MSARISKLLRILIIALLVLFALYPVITMSIGIIVVANEEKLLKIELDNTYINSGYAEWKSAEIADWESFMIPKTWNVVSESDNYKIYDVGGKHVACCAILGSTDSRYPNRESFIRSISEEEILNITDQHIPGFVAIDFSNYSSLVIEYNGYKEVYHYISLRNNLSPELFIIFPHDSSVEKGMLIDIAQAIVYSYAFPDE